MRVFLSLLNRFRHDRSGNLALAYAHQEPRARVWAADLSEEAVELARRNAQFTGLAERIEFHAGDLFAPLPESRPAASGEAAAAGTRSSASAPGRSSAPGPGSAPPPSVTLSGDEPALLRMNRSMPDQRTALKR